MAAYQSILVFIDHTDECQDRVGVAAGLARDFRAQLIGLYLDSKPEIAPSIAALLPNDVVEQYLSSAADAQRAAESAFRQSAAAHEVSDLEWRAPAGPLIEAAVAHGRCADLMVVSQPRPAETGWSFPAQLGAALLLESGRPLLFVPYVGARSSLGANILVAWDGGREAARAIADAMPLLARARQVTVASLDPLASERGVDATARERLLAYLRRHGVSARIEHDELREGDVAVGDWLLSRAADIGSDLLVMGGYGHPRWQERMLGGATRALLGAMTLPVLMAH